MAIPLLSRFTNDKQRGEILCIDLGTYSVKTSLIQLPDTLENEPKLLGASMHAFGRSMLRGRELHDLDGILDVIGQSVEHVALASGKTPKDVILGLSAASIVYTGLTTRIARQKPDAEITSKEIDILIKRIEEETLSTAQNKAKLPIDWEHLGVIVTDYRVDGTLVTSPVGLTGEHIECIVVHGFWDHQTQKTVDLIGNQLGLEITMVWETAVARALSLRKERESFVVIDVGGRAVELVLVKNRRLVSNLTVNTGSEGWTDALMQELQLTTSQAVKIKEALQQGELDQDRAVKAREVLEEEVSSMIQGLLPVFHELDAGKSLPPVIFLMGEGALLDSLKSKALTFPWNKDGLFPSFPHIEQVQDVFLNHSLYYGYDILS